MKLKDIDNHLKNIDDYILYLERIIYADYPESIYISMIRTIQDLKCLKERTLLYKNFLEKEER